MNDEATIAALCAFLGRSAEVEPGEKIGTEELERELRPYAVSIIGVIDAARAEEWTPQHKNPRVDSRTNMLNAEDCEACGDDDNWYCAYHQGVVDGETLFHRAAIEALDRVAEGG